LACPASPPHAACRGIAPSASPHLGTAQQDPSPSPLMHVVAMPSRSRLLVRVTPHPYLCVMPGAHQTQSQTLSSCSCRRRTHIRVCTACHRGLDDVRLPIDDARLPSSTSSTPCTCACSCRSHVSLLAFACAVGVRRHRPFALCHARDPRTLVSCFAIIIRA
jgi:hypothetical protein